MGNIPRRSRGGGCPGPLRTGRGTSFWGIQDWSCPVRFKPLLSSGSAVGHRPGLDTESSARHNRQAPDSVGHHGRGSLPGKTDWGAEERAGLVRGQVSLREGGDAGLQRDLPAGRFGPRCGPVRVPGSSVGIGPDSQGIGQSNRLRRAIDLAGNGGGWRRQSSRQVEQPGDTMGATIGHLRRT